MTDRIDPFERSRTDERVELARAAQEADLYPYFRHLERRPGPVVQMEGEDRVMLGSNNYLGLTGDDRVMRAAREALDRYGTALTGSRLLNGTIPLHEELEHEIAAWMGTGSALVFTTGYQANVGCLTSLMRGGDTIVCDSANHASLVDGATMSGARIRPFRHLRTDRLETSLRRALDDGGATLVVVDGVFSMEGDVSDLTQVTALCRRHDVRLMVDEAHGVGVLGARGAGACELFAVEDAVDLRMGTFSKSLASCGGFIAGPADVIDAMRVTARPFLFTAAAVPAAVAAALAAVRICRSHEGAERMARVLENARCLHAGLRDLGFDVGEPHPLPAGDDVVTPILPIRIGDDIAASCLWKVLYEHGVYANVALYPAVPRGAACLRTSVMATHEREHLDRALLAFEAGREMLETRAGALA